ncbi:MAG: SdrD B-like domain-containing protein [Thermoleophilia bacterium]
MTASQRMRAHLAAVVLAMVAMLVAASGALGAGITLDRTVSPPQAVVRGSGTQFFNYQITFTSTADRYVFTVMDPNGVQIQAPVTVNLAGQGSPISGNQSWTPPANAAPGRYTAELNFFSSTGFEAQAKVTFDVADSLGTLELIKYEDINGNGVRNAADPGVANWSFNLINPQGDRSAATTLTGGNVSLTNIPAGVWRIDEVLQPGWVAISPPGATANVTVPANGTGSVTFGNARPAPLTGTVWVDANGNARIDAGESGRGDVTLTLTGTTGLGDRVTATTVTAGDGTYEFPGLLPGSYNVRVVVPNGFSATTPVTRTNRIIRSNIGNPNNNFGITQGSGTITQTPDIGIDKRGPATAQRGQAFWYTIIVNNRSNFVARNVQVTDLVPADLTLVAIPAGATIRNGVVTWNLGNMRAGARRVLRMRVRVNPTTARNTLVNTATVTATGLPPRRDTVTTKLKDAPVVRRTGAVTG